MGGELLGFDRLEANWGLAPSQVADDALLWSFGECVMARPPGPGCT